METAHAFRATALLFAAALASAANSSAQTIQASTNSVSLSYPNGPLEQDVQITTSSAGYPGITPSTQSGGDWLVVIGTWPVIAPAVNIFVAPTLPAGVYRGTVAVSFPNGPPTIISVTLTVTGWLIVSPTAMTFNTASSAQQTLTVTGPTPHERFTIKAQTLTGGPGFRGTGWLSVSPDSPQWYLESPVGLQVTVNAGGISPGTYTGEIDLAVTDVIGYNMKGMTQRVPVTFTVPDNKIIVQGSSGTAVSSLSFAAQAGGTGPAPQQIRISSASGGSGAPFSYSANASWLLVNGSRAGQAATPATVPVAVSTAGLGAGSYAGVITITPTGGLPSTIQVNLTVTPAGSVSAAPATFTLSCAAGGAPPQTQTIQVSGNGGSLPFTATAASAGNWLAVSPASGTAPASGSIPLSVSFTNLGSLAANQVYTGTIVVAGAGPAAGSTTITVTLSVSAPLPTIVKVTNAASFQAGPVAAGEMITIFGTTLGPDQGVAVTRDLMVNGRFPTTLGGVQVLVGGYPAPMLYASATQLSAIVPYEINSPAFVWNPNVQVKYLGRSSIAAVLSQTGAAPGLFTANSSGSGQGAILNADHSVNSSANPADKGAAVVLYLTGEGQTIPIGVSGGITPLEAPFPRPVLAPVVTIDGQPARVFFYGEAPGLVAGMLQVNVVVPLDVPSGDLPVVVTIGEASSQTAASDGTGAVTVSVR